MHKLEKVDLNANREEISEILEMLLCEVKKSNHDLYEHAKMELYEMENGKKLTEEKAMEWVKDMKPAGLHWTIDDTTMAMQKMGFNCDRVEFFIVANMMYNDYFNIVKDNEELALKLAYDWIKDEDAKDDKLYEYWKHVIKRD